ncbi:MAG TPA: PEP-CTERM/exosortase system-associated acyltransferase [Rheinheimera sp.]|uniref:PEP-CTERM/exosortase system-associated acyltransferase n=1 Tax=Rheinheimera TaxID=67575 RepID=UPI002F944CA9
MKHLKFMQKIPVVKHLVNKAISRLASNDASAIASHFSQFLKVELANTDELKSEVFNVRHQVYCEELHFEDERNNRLEQDEFDSHSFHSLIRHVTTGRVAGTVRLITSEQTGDMLPIEVHCMHAITDPDIKPSAFPRSEICEISRLAVPETFRRRKFDQYKGAATGVINEVFFSEKELRCFPYIAICLYLSAALMALHNNKKHVFVMMEPRLARSLTFVGIVFKQLGEPVEYHGKRAAYYINPEMFRKNLSIGYVKLLESIERELYPNEKPRPIKRKFPKLGWGVRYS